MIEDTLMQYGVLGLWTATLLAERYLTTTEIVKAIRELRELILKKIK